MMVERVAELQGRLQRSRAALETLAARASELRAEVTRALPAASDVPRSRPESPLAAALDRLAQQVTPPPASRDEGDDGRLVSEAWEIALINEEGK
jgi:hypothetical protein